MKKLLRTLALSAIVAAPAFYASAEIAGSGTAEDPYKIATKQDLCEAYTKVVGGQMTYFVQTADIDMAGVEDWHALSGSAGDYTAALNYDGGYYAIKNFAPKNNDPLNAPNAYYCQTIFGVLSGSLKNLAVIDCNIDVTLTGSGNGGGVICAYAGHGSSSAIAPVTTIDNVYVTGKINGGGSGYNGVFCGTNATDVEITNCFANVELSGNNNVALVCGRQRLPMTLENVYVAGSVTSSGKAALVSSSDKVDIALTASDVVAFATGKDIAPTNGIKVTGEITWPLDDAARAAAIEEVKGWSAYKGGDEVAGLPGLNWNGTEAHPYLIATTEDLLDAYKKVRWTERVIYFKQTADIELWGVEEWHPINGGNGQYGTAFVYDGGNHTISGFAPKQQANIGNGENFNYYCTTVFGILNGTVKNLGIVDCDIDPDYSLAGTTSGIGGGVMCAYAGHGAAAALAPVTTIDNVYIYGTIKGKNTGYTGAFCGTTGTDIIIRNSYANVEISADNNVAPICGRQRNKITLENVYTAGTVTTTGKGALVCSSDRTPDLLADGVVTFATGKDLAPVNGSVVDGVVDWATEETKAELIAEIQSWDAFSSDKVFEGYPALAWQTDSELPGSVGNIAVEANGPVEYFNLQGVRVANPENGIFIRRQGNKATKVLVK